MARGGQGSRRSSGVTSRGGGRRKAQGNNGGVERVTRSSRAKLTNGLEDPAQVEKELNAQLRSMGLYAANITGDGNCLFRALSDQLYGYPNRHTELRQDVCDYLEARPERFAGFVEVEKPFDEYVRSMRQSGTYGGHMELSAFARLKQKEIKIVQPGLVYVISGDDESPQAVQEREKKEREREVAQNRSEPGSEGPPPSERALRRMRRTRKAVGVVEDEQSSSGIGASPLAACSTESVDEVDRQTALASSSSSLQQHLQPEQPPLHSGSGHIEAHGPLWIAYHSWEHYSSIRNVEGPHSGLPRISSKRDGARSHPLGKDGAHGSKADATTTTATARGDESDEGPTEEEELVLRSTNGYSLQQVRFYIKRHGGWEEALEAILANEAARDEDEDDADYDEDIGDNGAATVTQSLANVEDEMNGEHLVRSSFDPSDAGLDSSLSSRLASCSPLPDHMRDWRAISPSSVDTTATHSSAEGASASTHATTDGSPEASGSHSKLQSTTQEVRRSKRTASKDPTSSLRSPKRRSRSRSPMGSGSASGTDSAGIVAANAIAHISVHSGENTPVDGQEYASSPLGRLSDESGTESTGLSSHSSRREGTNDSSVVAAEDPEKTPRAKLAATPRPVTRTLTMRERREMRKADKVRRALDAKAKRQNNLRRSGAEREDEDRCGDDDGGGAGGGKHSALMRNHAADVKGFLELKI